MKTLIVGANGYIGTRLIPVLVELGHEIVALARIPESVHLPERIKNHVEVIRGDLLKPESVTFPEEIDAAYYLVHSMCTDTKNFDKKDRLAASNFLQKIIKTQCKQILYLTGLINSKHLSKHMQSRLEVEKILQNSSIPITALRAGIIIGSGSASFEIIRDLTEKLPIMVGPKWITKKCQPIAIRDALFYLSHALGHEKCIGQTFDIGGPDILEYKEMLYGYAKARKLIRLIITVPVLTPRLSSYWLKYVTSTNLFLARSLIDSMTNDAVCTEKRIQEIFPRKCLTYMESIHKALAKIEENSVVSSWKDSLSSSGRNLDYYDYIQIPKYGCYKMTFSHPTNNMSPKQIFKCILEIGGSREYYYMNWAWRLRGLIDRLIGGVGGVRGKTHKKEIHPGDVIDFWRVLQIDKVHYRLLLFAEMKVPGEAWLEFNVNKKEISQTATFRPKGCFGRFYWWLFYPIHLILFPGLLKTIIKKVKES